jgi:NADH:ubiquinone oxidoreductase subunit 3 (subunit A)
MTACLLLTTTLFLVSFILSPKSLSFEKGSPYECGFEPFGGDAHSVFNIQYFIVGILFMLFDLELAYLFVWSLHLGTLSLFSFWVVIFFLVLLVVGFIYE